MAHYIITVDGTRYNVNVIRTGQDKFEVQAYTAGRDDTGDSEPTPAEQDAIEHMIRELRRLPPTS